MPVLSFPTLSAPSNKLLLEQRLKYIFQSKNFTQKTLSEVKFDENWGFYGDLSSRLNQLNLSLNASVDYLWASRGGYGVSDLLGKIELKNHENTIFIGFSDFTSLMSARYAECGGLSWHASMPGGAFWYDDELLDDFLLQLESSEPSGEVLIEENIEEPIKGKVYGGCFSVLTNLIGTPYFPKSLDKHILILEDIEEHPARLMRYWRQWENSGVLQGVSAVVFGRLVYKDPAYREYHDIFIQFLKKNSHVPIYTSNEIGHIHNNKPFLIGADAVLEENKLKFSAVL